MTKALLLLLVVGAVFVHQTEGWGWVKKVVNNVKNAVDKAKDFVQNHTGINLGNLPIIGKRSVRSVDDAGQLQLQNDLEAQCAEMGISAGDVINLEWITAAYNAVVQGGSGLNSAQLDTFEGILEVVEECMEIERRR